VTPPVLSDRALGRATLARQLLLERHRLGARETVEHLVGLQAQVPANPYVALWSRLEGFAPAEVEDLLLQRELVRTVVMRGTLHLVTVDDAVRMRAVVQPVLDRELERHSEHKDELAQVDLGEVADGMRAFLGERPRTPAEVRAEVARRWPARDPAALAYACRNVLPVVQATPRGLWHRSGQVAIVTIDGWTGRPVDGTASLDDLVLRYLAAFGPASVADVATWTRLTGLGEVVDRLRPRLRTFRTEAGRELMDVPDGLLPDPDVEAPVRFLPEYDNVLLSHADRSRFATDEERRRFGGTVTERVLGTALVDGRLAATWSVRDGVLVVRHGPVPKRVAAELESEAVRLAAFVGTADRKLTGEVRLEPV
jgi:hypothetical protein